MNNSDFPQLFALKDSPSLRKKYFEAFIKTESDWFLQHIATQHQFSDGKHYSGYLWECLREPVTISYESLCSQVSQYLEIFVMADDHSREKILLGPLWPFPPNSVIRITPDILLSAMAVLPEDLYIFDNSFSWTLITTHEHNDEVQRVCCSVNT